MKEMRSLRPLPWTASSELHKLGELCKGGGVVTLENDGGDILSDLLNRQEQLLVHTESGVMLDITGAPTIVMLEVDRSKSAGRDMPDRLATFGAFQCVLDLVELYLLKHNLDFIQFAFQAPPGYPWHGLVELLELDRSVLVSDGREYIHMPGKIFYST